MSSPPTIVWFRQDLRLRDHPALVAACRRGGPVVPLYIWSPEEEGPWSPGRASTWWLAQSLKSLDASLRRKGSQLVIRRGNALAALTSVVKETGAGAVCWLRRYEAGIMARDRVVETELAKAGLAVESFNASLLFEPGQVATKQGAPYKVFTPFYKQCLAQGVSSEPLPAPRKMVAPGRWPTSENLEDLHLEPGVDWAGGIRRVWTPGEKGARKELTRFLDEALATYPGDRDRPDTNGTSRLSPHLHFGELSPLTVWHEVRDHAEIGDRRGLIRGAESYLRQVIWREFAYHLLFHFPRTTTRPLREEFSAFPWRRSQSNLRAWQEGMTGYPIVDAGMRQLWQTGWMHNRVRMIAASFLVKHLLLPWQEGAKWFWDTLVDADLANNTLGWQWTAGCGADAAPYFRIFNPIIQGSKFDPQGRYVKTYLPELEALPAKHIHTPWAAPAQVLARAGVALGETYPRPLVDHPAARDRALEAYSTIKDAAI